MLNRISYCGTVGEIGSEMEQNKPRIKLICSVSSSALMALGIFARFADTGFRYLSYVLMLASLVIFLFDMLGRFGLKRAAIALAMLIAIGIVFFTAVEVPIIAASVGDKDVEADYVIVLGALVRGKTPSVSLRYRLDCAADYMAEHPGAVAIVSGGQGAGEDITEAEAMEHYLISQGIPISRIIREDKSESTYQNISNSLSIISQRGDNGKKIAIVSAEYHLYRAKKIAQSLGTDVYGIPARTENTLMKINYFIREGCGVIYSFFFGFERRR